MTVLQQQEGDKGMFYIQPASEIQAKMTYTLASPQLMKIIHTEVDDALRGMNAGYQLVHAAVIFARAHQIKILPVCPFAKSVFEKKKEFSDVLSVSSN